MATNLNIDDRLLNKALRAGGHRTKRETVTEALNEYVQRRDRLKIIDVLKSTDWDPKYDYKKHRR